MSGRKRVAAIAAVAAGVLITGGAGAVTKKGSGKKMAVKRAMAKLEAKSGSNVSGVVRIQETEGGVLVSVEAKGAPAGSHGFHVHAKGDCGSPDGKSAGGHFNPANTSHGGRKSAKRHAGDWGNLDANQEGAIKTSFWKFRGVTLGDGPNSIVGKAIILHAKRDDMKSQPTGAAGARLACGVIMPAGK